MQHKKQTFYLPSSRTPRFQNSGTWTLQQARLQHTLEIQTEEGAAQRPQSVTWAESSSDPAVPTHWHASSQLGDTAGPSPILSWQQLFNTQNTGTDTSTVVIHMGQLLYSFQSSSFSQETPKPSPAPSPRSRSTNRKPQGTRKYCTDASTAVPDKGNIEINKVLIYCGKKKAGSGEWVGGEKQKPYLEKKENLKLNEACTPN